MELIFGQQWTAMVQRIKLHLILLNAFWMNGFLILSRMKNAATLILLYSNYLPYSCFCNSLYIFFKRKFTCTAQTHIGKFPFFPSECYIFNLIVYYGQRWPVIGYVSSFRPSAAAPSATCPPPGLMASSVSGSGMLAHSSSGERNRQNAHGPTWTRTWNASCIKRFASKWLLSLVC